MKFHIEGLSKKQLRVIEKLAPVIRQNDFYLGGMKLSAIAQRGARKDFCDIYALGTKQFALREMVDLYRKKFGIQDVSPVLYGLTYFDDAESERMPKMLWNVKWAEVKGAIQSWTKTLS